MLGGVYGAAGLGLALVWRTTGVLNLAHGAFVVLGAYVTFALWQGLGMDPFLSIPCAMAALFVLGWLLQRVVFTAHALLVTFGIELALVDLALNVFGPDSRSIQASYFGSIQARVFTLVVALALTALVQVLARGIRRERLHGLAFASGAAIAGAAGSLTAIDFSFNPTAGAFYTPLAFAVCLLGGLGSAGGVLIAGVAFGVVATLSEAYLGPGWQNTILFALLAAGLLVRRMAVKAPS